MTTIRNLPTAPSRDTGAADFNPQMEAFLPQLQPWGQEANAVAAEMMDARDDVLDAVAAAYAAPGTPATSTTSMTIATGVQSFTTQTGKAFVPGQRFVIASQADPRVQMSGPLISYNASTGAGSVDVNSTSGSGTFAAWHIGITAGLPLATAADIWAGTTAGKIITPKAVLDANVSQLVAFASTVTLDFNAGRSFHIPVTANMTVAAPANATSGKSGRIRFNMGGNFSVSWAASPFFFPGGDPVMPTSGFAIASYFVHADGGIECGFLRDFS